MAANFWKRFGAYLIDMVIASILLMLIFNMFPDNPRLVTLNQDLNNAYENVLKDEITFNEYLAEFTLINHAVDKERVIHNVINVIIIIAYFTIIPYFFMGQTVGKKIMGLRIVRNDGELLSINDLVIRSFVVYGLSYMLISLMLVYLLTANVYFIVVTILGFIQVVILLLTSLMIGIKKNKLGLQDILSKTKVININ